MTPQEQQQRLKNRDFDARKAGQQPRPASATVAPIQVSAPSAVKAAEAQQVPPTPSAWYPDEYTLAEPPGDEGGEGSGIPFIWATDVDSDSQAEALEIVEGVLTAGGMSTWYGDSNSGKSYLIGHLGFCIASGEPWLGQRVRQGAVIFVAAEGAGSMRQRIRAFRKHFGEVPRSFGLVTTSLNMLSPSADVEALVELIRVKAAEIGEPVLLVIVDTIARSMPGGNENAGEDMSRMVAGGDRIREETGAHVAWVHHSGKDAAKGARGWSGLRAAIDTEIEVTKDEGRRLHFAEIVKQRDLGTMGLRVCGRFVPIPLGLNEWGNEVTACIVEHVEDAAPPRREVKLPRGSEMAMQAIQELASESTRMSTATSVMPGGKPLVNIEAWRDRYYQRRGTTKDEPAATRRSEWNRAKKALLDAGKVAIWGADAVIW